ncbi:hypothetical protein N9J52_02910 [Flavobacteriales bacterium]|nr:hypothetical protein [Flavobacteriales bacterium]MDA9120965.1 hypothetical protein [Flavobacteriales bacterium]
MTQNQFYSWLENPATMDAASTPQLREVLKRYPYFQAGQMMLAKNLKTENHIDQLNQLQLAAVMVPNRKLFHDYLHDKKKVQPKVEETKQEESTLEVASEAPTEIVEVARESLYDLIPEPIVYQLETAELPELPTKKIEEKKETIEPEELSFSEWLEYAETEKSDSEEVQTVKLKSKKRQPSRSNIELVDHFLSQQSGKPKERAEFFNPQKAGAKSLEEDFTVVSQTLATIYFQQEKYELAKQSYEALSLKYPEKSVYFAARLKEIDDKLNSE